MLTGYFDESGHSSETDFFAVAAFVAEDSEWVAFDARWREALAQTGVPYLHMRQFAHRVGAFQGWTEDRRRALLAGCVAAIKSIRTIAVGAAVSVTDFRALSPEAQSELRDPFFCCFQEVVRGAAVNAYFEPQGIHVHMVFSQQDQFSSLARQLWGVMASTIDVRDRMASLAFEDMRGVPGLQAADLLAYELRHYYHLRKARPTSVPRWAFAEIVRHQRSAYNACMLKYLPRWYLEAQAEGIFEEVIENMFRNPQTHASQLQELSLGFT